MIDFIPSSAAYKQAEAALEYLMSNFSASALLLCSYLWYPLGSLLSFDLWCGAGLLLLQPTVRKKISIKGGDGSFKPLFTCLFDHFSPMGLLVG